MYYYNNMNIKKISFTEREKDIILLIFKGMTNKEIADKLSISIHTVKTHLEKLYDKHSVHTRTELAIKTYPYFT